MAPTGRNPGKVRFGDRAPGVRGEAWGPVSRGKFSIKFGVTCRRGGPEKEAGKG